MKKLSMFLDFNFSKWQAGKRFQIQSVKFNEKRGCVSLDVVIVEDATQYDDPNVSNVYEKFKVHCIRDTNINDVDKYKIRDEIKFSNIGRCVVWGEYSSCLSVEGIVVVLHNDDK